MIEDSNYIKEMEVNPSIVLHIPKEVNGVITYIDFPLVVEDSSYRYRVIMGEHTLNLKFKLNGYKEMPIGTNCTFQGLLYTLETPENIIKNGERDFAYDLIFQSDQYKLGKYIIRNIVPGDRRIKFSYTARPEEFLHLLVENMNNRDPNSGWTFNPIHVQSSEKLIAFNSTTCMEALQMFADTFDTEWEIIGKNISLKKTEYNKEYPLHLSYRNGLLPGITQAEYSDTKAVERLFAEGGDRNIDASKYRKNDGTGQAVSHTLLMPANYTIQFDGTHFDDEDGFVGGKPTERAYITDADGFSVSRIEKAGIKDLIEGSLDCSEIYPMREGTVATVKVVNAEKHLYDFTDSDVNIPNYTDYLIAGETMTVIFQTGMLTGREFDVRYKHPGKFEIVPQSFDGIDMPNDVYIPQIGGKYGVFNVMLPDTYISDGELRMLKEAVRCLYEKEDPKISLTASLDDIWAEEFSHVVLPKLILGGTIFFEDKQFLPDGGNIRVTGLKNSVNNPLQIEMDLSNDVKKGSWIHNLKNKIEVEEVVIDSKDREVVQYAKRRFSNVTETMEMLQDSLLNFSEGINPIVVQTMQAIVGDESLQFDYSKPSSEFKFKPENEMRFFAPEGVLTHRTLGIEFISAGNTATGYKAWRMTEFNSMVLDKPEEKYYLYAKVPHTELPPPPPFYPLLLWADFVLSNKAIALDEVADFHHLLVGILNSEYNGDREFVPVYGFTEILPGRITTDLIKSADGENFIDLKGDARGKGMTKLGNLDWNVTKEDQLTIKGIINVFGEAILSGWRFTNENIRSKNDLFILDSAGSMKFLSGLDGLSMGGIINAGSGLSVYSVSRDAQGNQLQSSELNQNGYEYFGIDANIKMSRNVSSGGTDELVFMSKSNNRATFVVSMINDRLNIYIDGANTDLRVTMRKLPTSSSGLSSGAIWRDGEFLKIVP